MTISADTIRLLMEFGVTGEALLRVTESIEKDNAKSVTPVTPNALRQARFRARQRTLKALRNNVTRNVTHSDDAALIGTSSSKLENTGKKNKKDKILPSEGQKTVTRAIPIEAWTPSEDLKKFALEELRLSEAVVAREMDTMRDWARSKDERKKDWNAAARNWLRRVSDRLQQTNGHSATGPPSKPLTGSAKLVELLKKPFEETYGRSNGQEPPGATVLPIRNR